MSEKVLINKNGALWVFESRLNGACSFIQGEFEMKFDIPQGAHEKILECIKREYKLEELGEL